MHQPLLHTLVITLVLSTLCLALPSDMQNATTWTYSWKPAPGEATPVVTVCPLKYDKRWAYAVEIDDGPISAFTVSQPLLERFTYTDAPPGVPGGAVKPFVGGVGVMGVRTGGNDTFVTWEQLRQLEKKGWGIINHGYWHSGYGWDPAGALKPYEFQRELYWSQALIAVEMGHNSGATDFIYPNGYMDYEPYLKQYGIVSGSRVAGQRCNLYAPNAKLTDLDRSYLDESVWSKSGDVMESFPAAPKPGDLVIDFTHGMEADPASANHKRWTERLTRIAARYGREGDDSMWCAPTPEIVQYSLAAKAAKVQAVRGRVTVTLPVSQPGAALTLKLTGVPAAMKIPAPVGGSVARHGNTVWLTTPLIGRFGAEPPKPRVKRIYEGPLRDVTFDKPAKVAGVRIHQGGPVKAEFTLKIDLVAPDGHTVSFVNERPKDTWGVCLLYPLLPDRAAVLSTGVRANGDPSLDKMEIWAEE